jgi:competence protein ComEC
MLVGELCGRRARGADALGLAGLLVLAMRPSAVWDPGFQLSFAAAATLVVASGRREPRVDGAPGWWRRIARAVSISSAVALATAPITAFHFHEIAIGGVIGNLIVTPMIEMAAIPIGLGGVALAAISQPIGGVAIDLAVAICGATSWLIAALANGIPSLIVPPPSHIELAASTVLWVAWSAVCRHPDHRRRSFMIAVVATAMLCGSWAWHVHRRETDDSLLITFLDVGQGDAAVIEMPGGAAWLIDAGGAPGATGHDLRAAVRPGEIVARFLRTRRINRIAVAILSHPHPDHYLGLLAVASAVPIDELWLASDDGDRTGAAIAPVLAWLNASGTRVVHPRLAPHPVGDVVVRILAPSYDAGHGARAVASSDPVRSVNDNSLVVAVERAGRRVLFAGDLEEEGEALLVAGATSLASDVVKVPHHGSPTSSTRALVAATHPDYAVVSLARGNPFGFPGADVVARWLSAGARVLRTDQIGAIAVRIDAAGRLAVSTFDRPSL